MGPKIKTVGVQYLVKMNEELVDAVATLRQARSLVKTIPLTEATKKVNIVKLTTTEQVLDVYEPVQTLVLRASQLDEGLTDE